eukprot:12229682-Karenia_brevis.AAC.1
MMHCSCFRQISEKDAIGTDGSVGKMSGALMPPLGAPSTVVAGGASSSQGTGAGAGDSEVDKLKKE